MSQKDAKKLYLGIDVGGTKMLAAVVRGNGKIIARQRCATPRERNADIIVNAIGDVLAQALDDAGVEPADIEAISVAIPGIIDVDRGVVVVAPNLDLHDVQLVEPLQKRFGRTVVLGNDVTLGTLGAKWMGIAGRARSAVGIFVGTGIGGGIIHEDRVINGHRGFAGEIGHMVISLDGPECACGMKGCIEAYSSRTAIEKAIRAGVAQGRSTVLSEMLDGKLDQIKSSALKRALQVEDELVTEVMTRAAEVLGQACINIRHILDPEVIVLGGGVIEACDFFIMPIVERVVATDPLVSPASKTHVVASMLGDDAVLLGAVALARLATGAEDSIQSDQIDTQYPDVNIVDDDTISVGGKHYTRGFYVRTDGKVKRRDKLLVKQDLATHEVSDIELRKICKGHTELVIIGAGNDEQLHLSNAAEQFLRNRKVEYHVMNNPQAIEQYNASTASRALLVHQG